jgi:hypothetical protein
MVLAAYILQSGQEGCGNMQGPNFFENLLQDIRYAGGTLRRSPGSWLPPSSHWPWALALGIGANTAIFTVINTVSLQPLSYPKPDRIVPGAACMDKGLLGG